MPQFAVYDNPGRNGDVLFFVQVQTTRLDRSVGRVVIPLFRIHRTAPADHPLTPHLTVQGRAVYADPLDIAALPAKRLRDVLEVLSENDGHRIIRAIDEMISQA